jgi:hypothetical protein
MNDNRLPKIVLFSEILCNTKRQVGKPEKAYRHCIKEDMIYFNIDVSNWVQLCKNKKIWRKAIYEGTKIFNLKWCDARKAQHDTRVQKRVEAYYNYTYQYFNNDEIFNNHVYFNNNVYIENNVININDMNFLNNPVYYHDLSYDLVDKAVISNTIVAGRGTYERLNNMTCYKNNTCSRVSRVLHKLHDGLSYDDIVELESEYYCNDYISY